MKNQSKEGISGLLAHPRFEVIPLKSLEKQLEYLPRGAAVSVTCSPRFGLDCTIDYTERLQRHGFYSVPHISARLVEGRDHLMRLLDHVADIGIRGLFVIGGDVEEPVGPFSSAGELLKVISEGGYEFESIGIGCYPEGHPLVEDEVLWEVLGEKEKFASYMVTQMCFERERFLPWVSEARERGIDLPVYIGIPGAAKLGKLIEISLRIGVGDSIRYLRKQRGMAGRFLLGEYRPDDLVEEVARLARCRDLKVKGVYIYTFNQLENTECWRREASRALN